MEMWQENHREEIVMVDMEQLVPKDHLLRKVEKIMDYKWLYERLSPLYCHDNGRNGTDPVVLIKMVLIQHLFGIPSLRQTYREIQVNVVSGLQPVGSNSPFCNGKLCVLQPFSTGAGQ